MSKKGKYKRISFRPPKTVANQAAKGLRYRRQAGGKGGLSAKQAKAAGVGSGVQRAVNLKNQNNLSPTTVKRMNNFFSRHQKNKAIAPGKKPYQDKGHVAWLLWGGDAGQRWAKRKVAQMNKAEQKAKAAKKKKR